jgi:hypothetical protein
MQWEHSLHSKYTATQSKHPIKNIPSSACQRQVAIPKDIPRPDTSAKPPRTGWVKDPAGAAKRRGRSPASFTQTSMVAGLHSGRQELMEKLAVRAPYFEMLKHYLSIASYSPHSSSAPCGWTSGQLTERNFSNAVYPNLGSTCTAHAIRPRTW